MKVTSVKIDSRKRELLIMAGRKEFRYPLAFVSSSDVVVAAAGDEETGNEAVTCVMASGQTRTIHLDDIQAQLGDADYLRQQMLYDMTLQAQKSVSEQRVAKRALCRMLQTSPAQVYRLLDQTCYSKTVDQMLRLLQVLGCTVKLEISQAA